VKIKVLVVEDSKVTAKKIKKILEKTGAEVVATVATAQKAIQSAMMYFPDLILMDIILEGDLDGIDAAEQIQNKLDIPIIYITAYATADFLKRARSTRPFGYIVKPFRDVDLTACMEMAFHKHQIESELEQKRKEMSTILKSVAEGVISTDSDGSIRFINQAAERILGVDEFEATGKQLNNFLQFNDLKSGKSIEIPRAKGSSPGSCRETGLLTSRLKEEIIVEYSSSPLVDSTGNLTGQVLVISDLTEQRRLEEKFQQSQKLEIFGRLAGGIVHDFNNVLTGIIGNTELSLLQTHPGSEIHSELKETRHLAEKAAGLTRRLLSYSRPHPTVLQPTNLNEVIKDTSRLLNRLIGEDIRLIIETPADLKNCLADPAQIEQVLMNLAVNAKDAMPEGGELTIKTDNVILQRDTLPGISSGPCVLLSVADTGTGMDMETQEKIFDPFFTTKDNEKGTGLGLATVKSIIRRHQGTILVESRPGSGTSFRIYLPTVIESDVAVLESIGSSSQATLLLVDPQKWVRKIICRTLIPKGYEVFSTSTFTEAVDLFRQRGTELDLLLTEVRLPGGTGPELFQLLKSQNPDLKALFLSAGEEGGLSPKSRKSDTFHLLTKPFLPDKLIQQIQQILDSDSSSSSSQRSA
jgi:PAS domain S-box-containing protein